jgi:uncharacterized membrane protein HdeD (DUF308 family)
MAGMIQIVTYLLAIYLVFKGVEILQLALCSPREKRGLTITIGIFAVVVSIFAGIVIVDMQDKQAGVMSSSAGRSPY